MLLGKCREKRETEEVSIGRARAGRTGSGLARFLTHEFQGHRTAAPRLQRDRHLQCVEYVNHNKMQSRIRYSAGSGRVLLFPIAAIKGKGSLACLLMIPATFPCQGLSATTFSLTGQGIRLGLAGRGQA